MIHRVEWFAEAALEVSLAMEKAADKLSFALIILASSKALKIV